MKKELMYLLNCMGSKLIIILLNDNTHLHVDRMTLQKFIDLRYETLLHPPYSLDLSPSDYKFFKHVKTFSRLKTFRFKDFLALKPLEFYHTCVNNLGN